jgi:hypothetical protein
VTAALLVTTPATAARLIYASPAWAAFDHEQRCTAVSRAELVAIRSAEQARVAVSFDRDGGRRGELHFRLSRPAAPGTAALLQVGGRSFQLPTRGPDAWSSGPPQERAILAAIRAGGDMRLRFRSLSGGRTDRYLLPGAPTAIDAAAAACSRRG